MYSLNKVKIQDIIKHNYSINSAEHPKVLKSIRLPESLLFQQLNYVRGNKSTEISESDEHNKPNESDKSNEISEFIFVEAKRNKQREDKLKDLLRDGFKVDGNRYVRFGKSPSQGKDGITTFIKESLFDEMTERSKLGLNVEKCVISKYESYRSLIFSSCHIVENAKLPNIVIIDEYEKKLLNQKVRYAVNTKKETLNKETGEKVSYSVREIVEDYDDVNVSPFDGFGLHTSDVNELFSSAISETNKSKLFQIRMPFMKGVSVEFKLREYLKNILGVNEIKDVFGKTHKVDDIDCLWNTTMWKGYSYFKAEYGDSAWEVYLERVKQYGYGLGISKYSHYENDLKLYSRLNFQYLQCLDLINPKYIEKYKTNNFDYDILDESNHGKIINMSKYTTDLIEKIVQGDKLLTLKFLGISSTEKVSKNQSYLEQAILINDEMLEDVSVVKMLKRRVDKTINMMKYGKIYVHGFYHTVIGDVIGYLEFAAGKEVKGCLKAHQFFAKTLKPTKIASMRSPLVDASEVNIVNLIENEFLNEWFGHFKDQDIVMINMYDLSMQQQGGMDMDGDGVFLTDDETVVDSKIHLPIVVDREDKQGASPKEYNIDNIIEFELNSRDNRIGEITNIATSILNQYTEDDKWKKIHQDNIALLRLYQGKEIDFLKTGFRWHITKNLSKYKDRLPYFLMFNYPKKMNTYKKIKERNKSLDKTEKLQLNAFHSPTPLNELCEYICEWERKVLKPKNTVKNSLKLLTDDSLTTNDRKITRAISTLYDSFSKDLRAIDDKDEIGGLYEEYAVKLKTLQSEFSQLSDEEFINYCIKTAYRSIAIDKSLCWHVFGEEMISNLKTNTKQIQNSKVVECDKHDKDAKEFLGRYYKLIGDDVVAE